VGGTAKPGYQQPDGTGINVLDPELLLLFLLLLAILLLLVSHAPLLLQHLHDSMTENGLVNTQFALAIQI